MSEIKFKIKKGDTVKIITGKEKGKIGKVLKVVPDSSRIYIEKLNMVKRHMRPTQKNRQGGIVEKEASIHISNVMIMCNKCNKPVKIKAKILKDKTKVRICAKCDEIIKSN